MGVYKEGKNWKVQVYYKDWQGKPKRENKNEDSEPKVKQKSGSETSFSNRARVWISNSGTSWKSTIRIWMSDFGNTPCIQNVTSLT